MSGKEMKKTSDELFSGWQTIPRPDSTIGIAAYCSYDRRLRYTGDHCSWCSMII